MAELDMDTIQGSLGQIKAVPEEQFYDLVYLYETSKRLWEISNKPIRAFNPDPIHVQFKSLVDTGKSVVSRFSNKYTLHAVDRDTMEEINPPVLEKVLGDDGFFDANKLFEELNAQEPMILRTLPCNNNSNFTFTLPQSIFFIVTENPAGGTRISRQNIRQILLPIHINGGEYLTYLSLIPGNKTPHGASIFHNFPQTRCIMRDLVDLMIEYEEKAIADAERLSGDTW